MVHLEGCGGRMQVAMDHGAARCGRIEAHDATRAPMFMYLALHNVHQPVEAPEALVSLYPAASYNASTEPRRVYNAMHSGVELVVRNLTEELRASGLWNTSVLLVLAE